MEKTQSINRLRNRAVFLGGTLAGVLLFLIPIPVAGGGYNLVIGLVADGVLSVVEPVIPMFLSVLLVAALVLAVLHYFVHFKWIDRVEVLKEPFSFTGPKLLVRILGTALFVMTVFQIGPEWIWSADTGGTMLSLMVTLSVWHFLSFYLFSLLMDFGAMDFLGTIIQKVMRPLFTLPGSAAITCIAAWIGNGPLGVIVTKLQYDEGYYTKRESAVIATCFSIVSITFCVIVARTLNLLTVFVPFYITVCICTLLCSLILPRIYPLRQISDTYCPNPNVAARDIENVQDKYLWTQAVVNGEKKAATVSLRHMIQRGNRTAVDFFLSLYPVMMVYGTVLLIISHHTPVVKYLAAPMEMLLGLLQVPAAEQAAPALLVGFVDMFLPAVLGSGIANEMTRFIIAVVSISQLIYMTETGVIILKNKDTFQVKFLHLVFLFLVRTAISLPIAILIANLIY